MKSAILFLQAMAVSVLLLLAIRTPTTMARLGNQEEHPDNTDKESVDRRSLIVRGRDATVGDYPYFATRGGCGGSLIKDDLVLTAAHCPAADREWVRVGDNFAAGQHCWRRIAINGVIRHPSYNANTGAYDVMLLRLDSPCTNVSPVELEASLPGFLGPLVGIGLGRTDHNDANSQPTVLQEADFRVLRRSFCDKSGVTIFEGVSWSSDMMCYGYAPSNWAAAMARGDSGTPVLNASGKQVAVQTQSSKSRHNNVNAGIKIASIISWINRHRNGWSNVPTKCRPACRSGYRCVIRDYRRGCSSSACLLCRRRGSIFNPLDCLTTKLRVGQTIHAGQGIYFGDPLKYPNSTRGAYEFGLTPDGHPIYYDHLNHDPEVVIWKNDGVTGDHFVVEDGGVLALYDKNDTTVWQVGGGSKGMGSPELQVSPNGVVKLTAQDESLWSLGLDGNAVSHG